MDVLRTFVQMCTKRCLTYIRQPSKPDIGMLHSLLTHSSSPQAVQPESARWRRCGRPEGPACGSSAKPVRDLRRESRGIKTGSPSQRSLYGDSGCRNLGNYILIHIMCLWKPTDKVIPIEPNKLQGSRTNKIRTLKRQGRYGSRFPRTVVWKQDLKDIIYYTDLLWTFKTDALVDVLSTRNEV